MKKLIPLLITILYLLYPLQIYAVDITVSEFYSSYDDREKYSANSSAIINKKISYETAWQETKSVQLQKNNVKKESFIQILINKTKKILCKSNCESERKYSNEPIYNFLIPTLSKNNNGYFSQFSDPYDNVPDQIQDIYDWDDLWNPISNPELYLQCTAFVLMVYALNGIRLRGKVKGDAKEWIHLTNTFDVYKNGSKGAKPSVLDTVVWAEKGNNHTGIVSYVDNSRNEFKVLNANSSQTEWWFKYKETKAGKIVITDFQGRTFKDGFVPSHILKLKKEYLVKSGDYTHDSE